MAKTEVKEKALEPTEKKVTVETVPAEKKFKITLPLSEELSDDVKVCINGKWTIIQRGVEVEVSEPVYEVLKNKERMERLAFERRMALQDKNL